MDNPFNDISNSIEWWLILFIIIQDQATLGSIDEWEEFIHEIGERSHFFPKSKLLDRINNLKDNATIILKAGEYYYRARKFRGSFLDYSGNSCEKEELLKKANKLFDEYHVDSINKLEKIINTNPGIRYMKDPNNELGATINGILKRDKQFWGFNEYDSDAPDSKNANAGRANSKGISFLYAASDEQTAVSEIRPLIDQPISIATIQLKKDVKVFNLFDPTQPTTESVDKMIEYYMLRNISALFSEVNYGIEDDYLPTQYLCEFIRNLGFDGIIFNSSLNPSGKVLVLFDVNSRVQNPKDRKYEIIQSRVLEVNKIDIDYKQIAPLDE